MSERYIEEVARSKPAGTELKEAGESTTKAAVEEFIGTYRALGLPEHEAKVAALMLAFDIPAADADAAVTRSEESGGVE